MENRAIYFGSRDERTREFPASARSRTGFGASATVPVVDDGDVIGVVGMVWLGEVEFDEVRRRSITRTVQRIAPMLMRNLAAADPELDWLNTLLRLHLDPWILVEAVLNVGGTVRDFVVQDAAALAGADAQSWIGRRVLEIWPFLAHDPMFDGLRTLVQTGGSWSSTVSEPSAAPWGVAGSQMRAVRLGQRIAVVWRLPEPSNRTSSRVALPEF
jgi:hypothetical protein